MLAASQGKFGLATTKPLHEREEVKAELREKVQEPHAVEGSVGGAYDDQGYRPGPREFSFSSLSRALFSS